MLLILHSFIILLCLEMFVCQGEKGEKQSGNYEVKISSVSPCEMRPTVQMGFFNTRMSKHNRTHICITGLYSLPFGLNDDMQETWEIFSKGSTGGWKRFMTFRNNHACSDKKRLFPDWFKLFKLDSTPCPIAHGNYTFDCHNLTGLNFTMARVMTYGVYKAKVNFYHKGTNIGCTDFIADVVPTSDKN